MNEEEEFNLSEKIRCIANLDLGSKGFVYIEDVKEFIKQIKENYKKTGNINWLDKLAGDDLK